LSLEELVQELIADGKGDAGRLEHILSTLKKGQSLYGSDQEYLQKLLVDTRQTENPEPVKEESKSEEPDTKEEISSEQSTQEPPTEIEQLRKEIHKLQDRNHVIEQHLKNSKSGSMLRAFGRGIGGVFLILFGLGMVLALYYHFTNLDNAMRSMGYGADPLTVIILFIVVFPAILLSIGGSSLYYGIRIISKT